MSSCEDVEKFFEGLKNRVDEVERNLKDLLEKIESLQKIEKIAEEDILKRFDRKTELLKSAMDKLFGDLRGELIEVQVDMIRRINEINEKVDDIVRRTGSLVDGLDKRVESLKNEMRSLVDDLDKRVGSLKNGMRDSVEYFLGKVNNIIYDLSSAVNKETKKIVENIERVADMSSEMTRLRRGQRRLLTLIIIQMILQIVMIYLFFFR